MKPKIAIVVSEFNTDITSAMLEGVVRYCAHQGLAREALKVVTVPGAVEIPLAAQRLARTGRYDAVIVLGAVILGDTDHYIYVCEQVNQGCQRVALDESLPVIFGVMTVRERQHAVLRAQADELNYGHQAAVAAFKMLKALGEIA